VICLRYGSYIDWPKFDYLFSVFSMLKESVDDVATCSYIVNMKDSDIETIGLRELSNSLSAFVKKASQGVRVLVTERGKVVAEIRKPHFHGQEESHPLLLAWEARGELRSGLGKKRHFPRGAALLKGMDVGKLLDELRGER